MSIIKISYNLDRDFSNYQMCFFNDKFFNYGRESTDVAPFLWPDMREELSASNSNSGKSSILMSYLEKNFKNGPIIKISTNAIQSYWNTIEQAYFDRLNKFMDAPVPSNLDGLITTVGKCPYNVQEGWFFVPLFAPMAVQVKTIMHESMHIVFRRKYEDRIIKRGVSSEGMLEITEALTVLLNWHFKNLLLCQEKNQKPTTLDLQETISQMYQQKRSFDEILEELILKRIPNGY